MIFVIIGILLIKCATSEAQSKIDIRKNSDDNSSFDPALDEIVSKAVMKSISRDLDAYIGLKVSYTELNTAFDSLQQEVEEISLDLLLISYQLEKTVKEGENKDLMLEKAYKMMEGYKALALKKSLDLVEMRKWRGRYFALGAVKIVVIAIPIAVFLIGTFVIMKAVK